MAVFWVAAPYILVELYDVSEVLATSIIRTISHDATTQKKAILRQKSVYKPKSGKDVLVKRPLVRVPKDQVMDGGVTLHDF
jgi:hypothetical protein